MSQLRDKNLREMERLAFIAKEEMASNVKEAFLKLEQRRKKEGKVYSDFDIPIEWVPNPSRFRLFVARIKSLFIR